jgi:protein-disulfide isomerase
MRTTTPSKNMTDNRIVIIATIVVVAVVGALAVILLSNTTGGLGSSNYTIIPQSAYEAGNFEQTDPNAPTIVAGRTSDGAFILGDPDAPVTIIEFADFRCPHCQEYAPEIKRFKDDFVATGKARFEYRMFRSVDTTGTSSMVAECADMQREGAFWEAHDEIYRQTSSGLAQDLPVTVARTLGLNSSELLSCLTELGQGSAQVFVDSNLGQSLGVQGTPGVMIRYGNSEPTWITWQGRTYDRGGVPYDVLAGVVNAAQIIQ